MIRRCFHAVRGMAQDPTIPRWVRWLLTIGVLPIPGPVDEIALAVAAGIILVRYRHQMVRHYEGRTND